MVLSIIEILAYFPKFQKATRHTWKSLTAHRLRTTGLELGLVFRVRITVDCVLRQNG